MRDSYNTPGHPWGMKIILPYGFFETIHYAWAFGFLKLQQLRSLLVVLYRMSGA
jgi:hypothetical protein